MPGQAKIKQIGEVGRHGGWRGSPNTIANLLRWRVPLADQRKCARCGGVALRGNLHCMRHAGLRAPTDAAGRAESRLLQRLEHIGLLPLELIALPAWRELTGLPRRDRAPMRVMLLQAWDKRDRAPLHWAQCQRQARELARRGSKTKGATWWRLENA